MREPNDAGTRNDQALDAPSPRPGVRSMDHIGITVADLDAATAFFTLLGLTTHGDPMDVEGEFLDTVIGMPGSHTRIVMLHTPSGGTTVELSSFVRPDHRAGSTAPMANELGIRNVAFMVDDLDAVIERVTMEGYELVGGVGEWEGAIRMAYVRGPEGIIVSLAESIDQSRSAE
ncbi:MAG: VOC family protein [Microbacterium sp.]|nr:VOC family protein [Microbacterium sp.]